MEGTRGKLEDAAKVVDSAPGALESFAGWQESSGNASEPFGRELTSMVKRLPYWGKLAYGVGAGGYSLIDRIMVTWLILYVLEPIRGQTALISGFAFGVVMFLAGSSAIL